MADLSRVCLSRGAGEDFTIGPDIRVRVLGFKRDGQVRFHIEAPRALAISHAASRTIVLAKPAPLSELEETLALVRLAAGA